MCTRNAAREAVLSPSITCIALRLRADHHSRHQHQLPVAMGSQYQARGNPFADSSLYDVNTTYVPPDLNDTVDAVVPAIPVAGAPAAAAAAAAPAAPARQPPQQPAVGVPYPAPVPVAAGVPAVPAVVPALQFTESNLSSTAVTGSLGQAGAAGGRPAQPPAAPGGGAAASTSLPGDADDPGQYPFWNVRRYRPYFDVDTKDVVWRVGSSFLGPFKPDFMAATMARPDLYGPFWVATTLIFVTAVAGNYADFIAFRSEQHASPSPGDAGAGAGPLGRQWYTDYAKMSFSALLFYGYVFVWGLALYFALRWFRSEIQLVNVWCIYGYSLTIFVPMAFVCIVPLGAVRWAAVMAATALSGLFIVANLKATIYDVAPARALLLLGGLFAAHAGLGLALRLYFFHYSGGGAEASGSAR